jgi:hypothetical protein
MPKFDLGAARINISFPRSSIAPVVKVTQPALRPSTRMPAGNRGDSRGKRSSRATINAIGDEAKLNHPQRWKLKGSVV